MSLFSPNTDNFSNFYEKGKFLLAWRLILLFGIAFFMLSIIAFTLSYNIKQGITFSSCVLLSSTLLVYLNITKNYVNIYYITAIFGSITAFITLNYIHDILHVGDFLWQVLIIMFTFFGLGIRAGIIVTVFDLISIIYYFTFSVEYNVSQIVDLSLPIRSGLTIELITVFSSIAYLIYQFIIIHDHTNKELLIANESLKNQNKIIGLKNKENITLVQEVHHRVKNNLQIIISLLRLQKNEILNTETQNQFSEAINRIMVMSSIHQKLYKGNSLTDVNLQEYISELTSEINNLTANKKELIINVVSEIDLIDLKTIVPLGLIINELTSNSIKHAFKHVEEPKIDITILNSTNNEFILHFKDNGKWKVIKEGYLSFGLELLDILSSQLEGHFKREETNNGTSYIFVLKKISL